MVAQVEGSKIKAFQLKHVGFIPVLEHPVERYKGAFAWLYH